MKKAHFVCILLVALMIISLISGCSHEHKWKAATCANPKTCLICGKTEGKALGHNWKDATYTAPEICSRCGLTRGTKLSSNWTKDYYVDDFGDKTSNTYIRGCFYGTFSNSATTNSTIQVYIFIDKYVKIRIFEYNRSPLSLVSSDKRISIQTKDDKGNIWSLENEFGWKVDYSKGDLYVYDETLCNAIIKNRSLSFVITISTSRSSYQIPSVYRFKTDNLGLEDIMNS